MLTHQMMEDADKVITMGCGIQGVCLTAFVPAEDWQLEDPAGKPVEKVREIKEEIERKVKNLIKEMKNEGRTKANA